MRKYVPFLMALLLVFSACNLAIADTDKYNDGAWKITSGGDLIPITTNVYDIGSASLYPATICLGGECKSSWGSVVSPMTDASGYSYITDAGNYIRFYDAGYIRLGDATNAGEYYVLFTSDSDAWYAGMNDTTNDFMIGYGSAIGVTPRISVVDSATVTNVVIGDATQYDMQITFDGNAQDYSIGLDDTADDLIICLGSALGTTTAIGIDENLAIATYGDITMGGSTPVLTIGDAGEEDTTILFDGNAQDFYIALDDSADDLLIGLGNAVATTPAISINEGLAITTYAAITMTGTTPTLTVGDGGNEDNAVVFDGTATNDWTVGVDATAGLFEITDGVGMDATTAFSIANSTLAIATAGDISMGGSTPLLTIGDGGDEDTGIQLNSNTNDYYIASENALDQLLIGSGSAIGTTPAIGVDTDTDVMFYGNVSVGTAAANTVLFIANDIQFEGATNDSSEITLAITDPTADATITLPAVTGTVMLTSLATNGPNRANAVTGGTNQLIFEGATNDSYQTIITPSDPTAVDKTITLPDLTGTLGLILGTGANVSVPSILVTNGVSTANSVWAESNQITFEGTNNDTSEAWFYAVDPTQDNNFTLPDVGGTVMLSTLAANGPDRANGVSGGTSTLIFEGATNDTIETILSATDPTISDKTITLPNAAGTLRPGQVITNASNISLMSVEYEYGSIIVNTGATFPLLYNLTAPAAGMEITFYLQTKMDVDINPLNGTQILGYTDAAGDAISSANDTGCWITLRGLNTTLWGVFGVNGTWSDVN